MKAGDTQIPYDAQCPHGTYYSDCQECSGAKADFERACYALAEEESHGDINCETYRLPYRLPRLQTQHGSTWKIYLLEINNQMSAERELAERVLKAWEACPVDDNGFGEMVILARAYLAAISAPDYFDVVFDGPPSHESGRFVEVESPAGVGVGGLGEWIHRDDGYWVLRFPRVTPSEIAQQNAAGAFEPGRDASKEPARLAHEGDLAPAAPLSTDKPSQSPYSLGYNELAERVVELERELADAKLTAALHENAASQLGQMAVDMLPSHVAAISEDEIVERSMRAIREFAERGLPIAVCTASIAAELRGCVRMARSATGESEAAGLLREVIPMVAGTNHEKAIDLERRIVDFLSATESRTRDA